MDRSGSLYDVPAGIDPADLATELQSLEVDLTLDNHMKDVPSYMPVSMCFPFLCILFSSSSSNYTKERSKTRAGNTPGCSLP